jgi:uncharacterized protein YndB with AHSA1/START domain
MLKWLAIIAGAFVLVGVGLFLAGMMLPQDHTASRTTHLSQPPERVWATINDVAAYPSWRLELDSIHQLPARNGHAVWREYRRNNALTFEATTSEPPRHLVTRIADNGLPFGGSWDISISPEGTGSRIIVTEYGEIYNPLFRVMSKLMSQTATIDSYLSGLAGKLGDSYTPPA